jgi:hypothetical protein
MYKYKYKVQILVRMMHGVLRLGIWSRVNQLSIRVLYYKYSTSTTRTSTLVVAS